MKTVGADEAAARFLELLDEVEAGETITITRQDVSIAELCPTPEVLRRRKVEAVERIKNWKKVELPEGMTIKDMINLGRRY